jgi:hypothetical protein
LRIPALLAGLALFAVASPAAEPLPALDARPVPLADSATGSERIGQLRALGLLELPSRTVNGLRLAGLSDLAWDDDDGVLYALSDLGALFGSPTSAWSAPRRCCDRTATAACVIGRPTAKASTSPTAATAGAAMPS